MYGKPLPPQAIAQENLGRMRKPRKAPPTSWIATKTDTCHDCHRKIEPGQRVHNRPGVGLVHHRHDRAEQVGQPCPTCWLVGPCECE